MSIEAKLAGEISMANVNETMDFILSWKIFTFREFHSKELKMIASNSALQYKQTLLSKAGPGAIMKRTWLIRGFPSSSREFFVAD